MSLKKEVQSQEYTQNISQETEALLLMSLEVRLSMSYEERIEAHENARTLMEELKIQGELLRAKSQSTP